MRPTSASFFFWNCVLEYMLIRKTVNKWCISAIFNEIKFLDIYSDFNKCFVRKHTMFNKLSSLGTVLGQNTVYCWFGTWSIYWKSSVWSWIIRNYILSLFRIVLSRRNGGVVVMMLNATFNNVSVILCGGNRSTGRKPPTSSKLLINVINVMLYRVHLLSVNDRMFLYQCDKILIFKVNSNLRKKQIYV